MLFRELKFGKLTTFIGLGIALNLGWFGFPSLVQAEGTNFASRKNKINVNKKEVSRRRNRGGLPVHRVGGGSRGNCVADQGQLMALVPENSVGLTASTTPQLFFYVPETTQTHLIEFVVRNQQDELVYETLLKTTDRAGIIALELPAKLQQAALNTNENYHWYLSMICNQQKRSHDIVVEGWLRRIEMEPAISQKLQNANPLEKANLYQQQGIWHDALSVVAQAQKTSSYPGSAQAKWTELLDALGLKELANQPLIETN